ncbi:MAG: YdeI/OmpD-associated family protein [Bacteroidetes bacterium]|nr:YdeI/OmpD-associated family protein [Bacteroidota bacterium]
MNPIWRKLKIKSGQPVLIVNAPKKLILKPYPGIVLRPASKGASAALLFAENKKQLDRWGKKVHGVLEKDALFWIAFPKKSSGFQTDLTMYEGWDVLNRMKLESVSLVSLDEKWSAFRVRPKIELAKSRDKRKPEKTVIAKYVNSETRTVRLPVELKQVLSKNKTVMANFEKLSFTHKKEYVEWIVTAKQDKTKISRLKKMIALLKRGAKSPF